MREKGKNKRSQKKKRKNKKRKEKEEKEEEEKKTREKIKKKQKEDETKASSSSTPLSLSDLICDDDDQFDLISCLTKLIEKNKKVKSLQRTLMEVTDRLHNTLAAKHIEENPEQRAKVVVKYFDDEFIDLLSVAESNTHITHDTNIFRVVHKMYFISHFD